MANRPPLSPEDMKSADEMISRRREVWAEMLSIDTSRGDSDRWLQLRSEMNELMDRIAEICQVRSDPIP